MTLTLIGSRALREHFSDAREPGGDWDYQRASEDDMPDFFIPPGRLDIFTDARLADWNWGDIATPDELYTMKISHAFWEINGERDWDKHIADTIFLQRKEAVFQRELYDVLLPIWKERYRRNPTNLNQTAGAFFNDAVQRRYDHDSLHESVAYGERPLFESILQEGSDVMVDSAKFWAMDHDTQIMLCREEIYATALERIVIPKDYKVSPSWAYNWALRRTITSLFKGEWALFLLLNLDELFRADVPYVQRHLDNADRLRPYEREDNAA